MTELHLQLCDDRQVSWFLCRGKSDQAGKRQLSNLTFCAACKPVKYQTHKNLKIMENWNYRHKVVWQNTAFKNSNAKSGDISDCGLLDCNIFLVPVSPDRSCKRGR